MECLENYSETEYVPEKEEHTEIYSLDYFQILIRFQERKMKIIHLECWPDRKANDSDTLRKQGNKDFFKLLYRSSIHNCVIVLCLQACKG